MDVVQKNLEKRNAMKKKFICHCIMIMNNCFGRKKIKTQNNLLYWRSRKVEFVMRCPGKGTLW
jgi:hypothetical protein